MALPTPFYVDEAVTLYCANCTAIGHEIAFDHMITDPPYDKKTHAGARSFGGKVIEMGFEPLVDMDWLARYSAVAGWNVAFCALEMLGDYKRMVGDDRWVRGGFWRKPNGAPQFTGDRPGQPGEGIAIWHAVGKKSWNGGGKHAYYEYGVVHGKSRVHPTQKPEQLMAELVADFTDVGQIVFDPFAGSGTTLVAAKRLGRKAVGVEVGEEHCKRAVARLAQAALPMFDSGDLFPEHT